MAAMVAGVGAESYCKNSPMQAQAFVHSQPGIKGAIHQSGDLFANAKVICIADIGCSSGPNTIHAVDFVANEILERSPNAQIHAFFSDLVSNDYNTLFTLLAKHGCQGKPYFYASVPGSFYERLFPDATLHFAMCNISVHWLSKLPESVMDKTSPAWNAGRAIMDKYSSKECVQAFSKQAHEDLCQFLKVRARELLPGGILSLLLVGRASEEPILWSPHFQAAWERLVEEGLISQECFDSFNLPVYFRNVSEVEKAVEATQCFKVIHKLCKKYPQYHETFDSGASDYARKIVSSTRAKTKAIVEQHLLDKRLVELLYEKMESTVNFSDKEVLAAVVVILKRIN